MFLKNYQKNNFRWINFEKIKYNEINKKKPNNMYA